MRPVYGIDPSTKRISLVSLSGDGSAQAWTLSLHQGGPHRGARLSRARLALVPWLTQVKWLTDKPTHIALEQPFGKTIPIVSLELQGIILSALWEAFGLRTHVELVPPQTWKRVACGKGSVTPEQYTAWAHEKFGQPSWSEDECAAAGIATWMAQQR